MSKQIVKVSVGSRKYQELDLHGEEFVDAMYSTDIVFVKFDTRKSIMFNTWIEKDTIHSNMTIFDNGRQLVIDFKRGDIDYRMKKIFDTLAFLGW